MQMMMIIYVGIVFDGVLVKDYLWLLFCLILMVYWGEEEIVFYGDICFQVGDILVIQLIGVSYFKF